MRTQRPDPKDVNQLKSYPVEYRRVIALFKPYKARLAFVALLIGATSALTIVSPFIVRSVVDDAIPNQNVSLLLMLVGGMLGIAILTQVIGVIQTWMSAKVGQTIMHELRTRVFGVLQSQSLGFFTHTKSGQIQSRLTNDIAGMRSIVTSTATSIASNVTVAIATIIAMVALSPTLSLLSLIVLPPSICLTRKVALMRREVTRKQQETMSEIHSVITESLSVSGMRLTKTMGRTKDVTSNFNGLSNSLITLELNAQLAGKWRMATMQIIFAAIPALIYLIAGLPATSAGMTIGTLIAFTTLQSQIFRPLMGLLNIGAQWVASMALFSRIFEYLDLAPGRPEPADPQVPLTREIEMTGVSYRYPNADEDAVANLDLTIEPGQHIGIVGHTGSGKSTVASLLSALVDPTTGLITIGGVNLSDMTEETRTSIIGVVSQETYLIHDTLRANLLLANPEATEGDMWAALASANIAPLINSLPEGLDTVVGARGFRFSGGEQQRIAIARTILADPDILILDEATSALDNETEREVQKALGMLTRGRTVISIAHRLSTIEDADQILVMDHGRVIERGTHAELLALGETYAGLHGQQIRAELVA